MKSMDIPMVTIIVPVYNVEEYLEECMQSLQNQTLRDWEAVCINDCSTDGSLGILQRYAANDDRIRIVDNPCNKGVSCARNEGIRWARGKYIYFLDSDDVIVSSALEELQKLAEKEGLDGIFFDMTHVLGTSEVFEMPWKKDSAFYENVLGGQDFFWKTIASIENIAPVWMQFWRTEFLEKHQLFFCEELRKAEDVLFTFEAFMLANRVRCIHKAYHGYRKREDSLTSASRRTTVDSFRASFVVYCEILHFLAVHAENFGKDSIQGIESYANQYDVLSRELHVSIKEPGKIAFSNPMHEIMYRKFCENRLQEKKFANVFFRLYDRERVICICDQEWSQKLENVYGISLEGFLMIEPKPKQLVLDEVLEKFQKGMMQIYFSTYYTKLKPVLLEMQLQEEIDFMDGRVLFDNYCE
ncbi:MAG: glycosyltransferase [Selenomonadaceae bacterium]|nr:glycosyltransferase [Selenomonadaceae bacterium]